MRYGWAFDESWIFHSALHSAAFSVLFIAGKNNADCIFRGRCAREWESGTHPRSRADTTDSNETINTGACSIVGPTITLKSDSSKLSHNGQLKQPTSANFSAPLYATLRPTAHGAPPPPRPTTPHLCFILMPLCARFNRFAVFDLQAKRCFFITSLEVMFY